MGWLALAHGPWVVTGNVIRGWVGGGVENIRGCHLGKMLEAASASALFGFGILFRFLMTVPLSVRYAVH